MHISNGTLMCTRPELMVLNEWRKFKNWYLKVRRKNVKIDLHGKGEGIV